jgi:hypothetical protein
MAEKVLHEVRVVETDDGFRIEIKGDKERMKEIRDHFMEGRCGHGMGFGPGRHFRRHMMRHAARWGAWGPWGWWDDEDEDEEPAPKGEPKADA